MRCFIFLLSGLAYRSPRLPPGGNQVLIRVETRFPGRLCHIDIEESLWIEVCPKTLGKVVYLRGVFISMCICLELLIKTFSVIVDLLFTIMKRICEERPWFDIYAHRNKLVTMRSQVVIQICGQHFPLRLGQQWLLAKLLDPIFVRHSSCRDIFFSGPPRLSGYGVQVWVLVKKNLHVLTKGRLRFIV